MMLRVEEGWSHGAMMFGRMVLGKVIFQTGAAGCPIDFEVALDGAVVEPEKVHADGFGLLLLDGAVNDSIGSGIVGLEWCDWLAGDSRFL
jgi:hypothetical protein